ncbi:MAG: hypothetical protein SFT81_01360 [Candidatus Caenarcaniphilales bacterium]|nr:hypothetical protein [Candidatus Caenarcaniphilales bacterium]
MMNIRGTRNNDTLDGLSGDDAICGFEGDDILSGDDVIDDASGDYDYLDLTDFSSSDIFESIRADFDDDGLTDDLQLVFDSGDSVTILDRYAEGLTGAGTPSQFEPGSGAIEIIQFSNVVASLILTDHTLPALGGIYIDSISVREWGRSLAKKNE